MSTDVPIKYPYIGGTRWNFLTWADIPDARNPKMAYLRRLRILQTPWFALYLHWIFKTDDDRDPHDHPFVFRSFIVRGGYTERLWHIAPGKMRSIRCFDRRWNRFSWHKMDQRHAHMIQTIVPGTITFIVAGPKRENGRWGFYTERGFIPWKDYNREKFAHDEDALA